MVVLVLEGKDGGCEWYVVKSNLTKKIGHSFSDNPICPIILHVFSSKGGIEKRRTCTQQSSIKNICPIIFLDRLYLGMIDRNCTTYIIYILLLHLISNSVAIYGLTRNGQQDGQRLPKNQHPHSGVGVELGVQRVL